MADRINPADYDGRTPDLWKAVEIDRSGRIEIWTRDTDDAIALINGDDEESTANARLIADAPRILAELVETRGELERLGDRCSLDIEGCENELTVLRLERDIYREALERISKYSHGQSCNEAAREALAGEEE